MTMEWCLSCHRDPVPNVRPRERVFDMTFRPEDLSMDEREEVAELYHGQSMTNCSVCHR